MNSSKSIGGYFELELRKGSFPHSDGILLNSARRCFEYILRVEKPTKVYLPAYICEAMLEPLERLGLNFEYYPINLALELVTPPELKDGELLVYVNYFGLKDVYTRKLSEMYREKLVLDLSQAFYFEPLDEGSSFYSPRKFFGVSDGGILYTGKKLAEPLPIDTSYRRFAHLVKRTDLGAEAAYEDFRKDEDSLDQEQIKSMSALTQAILGDIDYENAKKTRQNNFKLLHQALGPSNKLNIDSFNAAGVPHCYPFLANDPSLKQQMIGQKIYVATYWPNVLETSENESVEYHLASNLVPLPIDQRYDEQDMNNIIEAINGSSITSS